MVEASRHGVSPASTATSTPSRMRPSTAAKLAGEGAPCVGARAGKGTAAGADERLDHGRGRSAKCHRVVGGAHKGRHTGGRLDHDSQGSRPASSRKYAGIFRDIHAIAVECFGIINQPGDRLGELALLEGKDAAVAGTERRDRGAVNGGMRIARPQQGFACILGARRPRRR